MRFKKLVNSVSFGKTQEANAARYLQSNGLRLLYSNYYCRHGEIDLIMADSEFLVFVEVRFRRQQKYGGAAASVTPSKQRKIRLTATHFLQCHPRLMHNPCRFDVLGLSHGVDPGSVSTKLQIDWIKNAFE